MVAIALHELALGQDAGMGAYLTILDAAHFADEALQHLGIRWQHGTKSSSFSGRERLLLCLWAIQGGGEERPEMNMVATATHFGMAVGVATGC